MSENNKKSDQKPNTTQRIIKPEQTETREIKQKDETKRSVRVFDEKKPTSISNTFPPSQPKDDKQDKGGDKNE